MNVLNFPLLSLITFLPLLTALLLLFVRREREGLIRGVSLLFTVLTFIVSLWLPVLFDFCSGEMQLVEKASWIEAMGVSYYMGVDGISLWLVCLSTLLSALSVLCSWDSITDRVKEYYVFLLLLETGMIGVFLALDFFLFYVFWEIVLVPMYFLIGIWGHPARRLYAAIKFFLYTLFGSVVMLLGILAVYFYGGAQIGENTFNVAELMKVAYPHTPVFLAGVLLKMGTYGFLRFNLPMFPEASQHFVPLVFVLSIIAIIYGAMVCMVQPDMKRLIAYSSVSHMGFVMLGMFAFNHQGVQGSILQMVNHGLSTGGLFLVVGLIYDRRHTRLISELGGLSRQMPVYATLYAIIMFASMGLPGLNGFIGEFLILIGAFQVRWWWGAFAVTGIILGAAYMLWLYQRTMFGEITKEENKSLPDLDAREMATLLPIIAFCFWIGLYPAPFLKAMEASVANVIQTVEKGAAGKAVGAKQASTGNQAHPGGTRQSGNQVLRQSGNRAIRQPGNLETRNPELPSRQIARLPILT